MNTKLSFNSLTLVDLSGFSLRGICDVLSQYVGEHLKKAVNKPDQMK